jgi:hypothetical protein
MTTRTLETDYLIVGCGAAGMAFADALIEACDADVVMIDRRHAPGGHWHDAYPFVRLHQPSAYYGVNSLPLGSETIDRHGPNQGFYERAGSSEICAYFDRVMRRQLLPSGKVRYFPMCEYTGDHRFVSRVSGDSFEVKVRKKRVDAAYLEPSVPATFAPPFEVAPGARVVPVNHLAQIADRADGFVIVGAGKTAIDACLWLLESGAAPESITWIKPRESWLLNRHFAQCGELVGNLFEGLSLQLEAAAQATSLDDLFARLEATRQTLRVNEEIAPTMYTSATMSTGELEQLRRIRNVVRLGRVRRIERDRFVLDEGTLPTNSRHLHVHCAAKGLKAAPALPIFTAERITLQPIRTGLIPFNSAIVAFIEATRDDLAEKNRLCPPNPLPDVPLDWVKGTLIGMQADYLWSKQPDLRDWLEGARLNPSRGIMGRAGDPQVQAAAMRFQANVRPGLERLGRLAAEARA